MFGCRPTLRFCATISVGAVLVTALAARAKTAWYESFESPQPSWHVEGGDARFEVPVHDRVQGVACTGEGCERLRVSGSGGTHVYFRHDVGRPRVIDELMPSVQIKSDRTGLQLAARVVLPRSADPRTGQPLRTVIRGSSYTQVGRWQQLRIEQMPEQLARQTRALRAELRTHVDPREAYVEHLLLNVYGGPGVTNVWIDDLDVAGHVATIGHWPRGAENPTTRTGGASWLPVGQRSAEGPATDVPAPAARVTLNGSVLLVDGRPMFPRIIEYQGEPLELFKRLGFNTVWLRQDPTATTLAEAKQLGVWLICPPPFPPRMDEPKGVHVPPEPIGRQYEAVLAWDLGSGLSGDQVPATRRWAEQIRAADRLGGRPLVCRPQSDLRAYSRYADMLLVGRPVLGTSLELTDYATWLRQRPRLARPGTPIWSTIQSQPADSLVEQWTALEPGQSMPTAVSSEQIRLMVYAAIASGSRGLLFESESPLDGTDPDTQQRALALEILNLEIGLAEPWLAAGSLVESVTSSEPEVLAAVLRTDRARLLVPIWSAPGAQLVSGQAAGNHASFIVPGVPEEYRAYLLTAGGLEPLRRKRETGGVRVTLDEFSLTALVLLTQDPLVVDSLTRRVAEIAGRTAELRRRLAAAKLQTVRQVYGQLGGSGLSDGQAATWLSTAAKSLQWCDGLLASRDYSAAYLEAERAVRPLRLLERSAWEASLGGLNSPLSSPLAVGFRTLPLHRVLAARTASAPAAANALVGGDFEDLAVMLRAGWSHLRHQAGQVRTAAELAPAAARSGQFGLRLVAEPAQPETADIVVETPPAWITSAPVYLDAGDLIVIHGWVQVPGAIAGSVDGLMIIDSLSGEALAERIGETAGWQEFTLYRAAPRSAAVSVTFALTGLGEAWVDDVSIRRLGPAGAKSVAVGPPGRR